MNAQLTKIPALDDFARLLKENGFDVILSKEATTYFHFFKDSKLGYVQKGYYSGYDYSSAHKPCKDFGTGLGILQNVMELSLENANKALNAYGWSQRKMTGIKYYESAQDYIDNNVWAEYYIL